MVQDRGDVGLQTLQGQADNLAEKGNQQPGLVGLFNSFRANTPQLYAEVDRVKCKTLGLALTDVFSTLQVYLGGFYANDFNQFGRTWQVNIQANAPFRLSTETVKQLKVRNLEGQMVPLGDARQYPGFQRPGDGQPLQHVSRRRHQRRLAAGRQLGHGQQRDGKYRQ